MQNTETNDRTSVSLMTWSTILMALATIAIAVANLFTYNELKKDYRSRTRPYIQLDFQPDEGRIYLVNYGQVFAKDVSFVSSEYRNNEWKQSGSVQKMVVMPNEKRSVAFSSTSHSIDTSALEEMKKDADMRQIIDRKTKLIEKIKFEVTYKGGDGTEYHTSRLFFCEHRPVEGNVGHLTFYTSQDDIVD